MNDAPRSAVDPDGIVLKLKPTRRGGRRRRRNKNRQNKKIDQLTSKIDKISQQINDSSNAHAQNNNNNIKKSTRDASTNTIISATNTNFDDIILLLDKKYTKLRSIHDGNDCYEESLIPFKPHDEAFYLPPRSKTLVKGEQSIKHTSSVPQDMRVQTSIRKNDTKYVYKRLLPEVNWKVGSIAFYRNKSSGQMMEVQIKQVIPSSNEHPITRYCTSFSSDLLYHNELYILKEGRE